MQSAKGGIINISSWYYRYGITAIANVWISLVILTYDQFSISLLLKTIFAPWRKDVVKPNTPSLNLIFQALALNVVSRLIGAVVRIATILTGLTLTLTMAVCGVGVIGYFALAPVTIPLTALIGIMAIAGNNNIYLGLLLTLLAVFAGIVIALLVHRGRKNPSLPAPLKTAIASFHSGKGINLAPYLSYDARQIVAKSRDLDQLKQNIFTSRKAIFIFSRALLTQQSLTANRSPQVGTINFLKKAAEYALLEKHERIEAGDLILALFYFDPELQKVLVRNFLSMADLISIVAWQTKLWQRIFRPSPLTDPHRLRSSGGIGQDWASGTTYHIDKYASNLSNQVNYDLLDKYFLAHRGNIDQIEEILARSGRHNILLVGEQGVGKRTIVEGLAARIKYNKSLRQLRYKKVIELNIGAIMAGASGEGELEARLIQLLNEAVWAGNIILLVESIDSLFDETQSKLGATNAIEILAPYLSSPKFQLIGTIDPAAYHRLIASRKEIDNYFEKIFIEEPNIAQTVQILTDVAPTFENKYQLIISYQAIEEIAATADRYLGDKKFPQKAIDLMDETATHLNSLSRRIMNKSDVDEFISKKTNIPINTTQQEQEKLLNLEAEIHQDLVNQEEAVKALSQSLRRARASVANPDKPIGSFLFLGPTGVGKTQTAKSLARGFFNSPKNIIRFDMSEFQHPDSVKRFIGNDATGETGNFVKAVRERPFSLILFDEIEKSHSSILNLFLQILDEGHLTDVLGQKTNFKNTIIIATSNAGSSEIKTASQSGAVNAPEFKDKLIDQLVQNQIFRAELLNRFTDIIMFRSLSAEELLQVVDIMEKDINVRLSAKSLKVRIDSEYKKKLARLGFHPEFGARALARVFQNTVENQISDQILKGYTRPGDTIFIKDEGVI